MVCVQVRLAEEAARSGADPGDVPTLVDRCRRAGLDLRGLMGVGPDPSVAGVEASDRAFSLLDRLCREFSLEWRSMGMSSDLESAVAHGATHVRIGTALFGER